MESRRGFDETEVVERALLVFWRLGYDGCAISDLCEATGVQRQTLYNTFGDKRGLFLAALNRYRQLVAAALVPLESPDADLAALRQYIESVLEDQRVRGCGACLLVKTAFAPQSADLEIFRVVEQGAELVRACFGRVLRRAVKAGELPASTNVRAGASYLYTILNGLSALAATGAGRAQITQVVEHAFSTLAPRSHA